MMPHRMFLACVCLVLQSVRIDAQESDKTASNVKIMQPGVRLSLLAEHPDLVTPTGIDLDSQGNLWVAACHTHFRPANYQGSASGLSQVASSGSISSFHNLPRPCSSYEGLTQSAK